MFRTQRYSTNSSKKKKKGNLSYRGGPKVGVSHQDVASLGVIMSMPQQAIVDRRIILIDPPVFLSLSLSCHHPRIDDVAQCNE